MNFVIVFAGSRLGQALFYYYFSEKDEGVREKHVSTSIVGSFGLGAILFAFAFQTAGFLEAEAGIRDPAIHGIFSARRYLDGAHDSAGNPTCARCARSTNQGSTPSFRSPGRLIASTVNIILLLTGWNMGVKSMLWSSIVSQACLFFALTWFVFRRVPLSFSWPLLRKQAEYSIPLSFSSVGEFIPELRRPIFPAAKRIARRNRPVLAGLQDRDDASDGAMAVRAVLVVAAKVQLVSGVGGRAPVRAGMHVPGAGADFRRRVGHVIRASTAARDGVAGVPVGGEIRSPG